jgi:hypothetical protein
MSISDNPKARIIQFNQYLFDLLTMVINKTNNMGNELTGMIVNCQKKLKNLEWPGPIGIFVDNIINNKSINDALMNHDIKFFKQYNTGAFDGKVKDVLDMIINLIKIDISETQCRDIITRIDTLRRITLRYVSVGGK